MYVHGWYVSQEALCGGQSYKITAYLQARRERQPGRPVLLLLGIIRKIQPCKALPVKINSTEPLRIIFYNYENEGKLSTKMG
jgi:hypothetical protein